jgi:hypothetical protein
MAVSRIGKAFENGKNFGNGTRLQKREAHALGDVAIWTFANRSRQPKSVRRGRAGRWTPPKAECRKKPPAASNLMLPEAGNTREPPHGRWASKIARAVVPTWARPTLVPVGFIAVEFVPPQKIVGAATGERGNQQDYRQYSEHVCFHKTMLQGKFVFL